MPRELPAIGIRVRRVAHDLTADPSAWAEALRAADDLDELKSTDTVRVTAARIALGRTPSEVVVKGEPVRTLRSRVRARLRMSRLDRQWVRAELVRERCATPIARDLALLHARDTLGVRWVLLITERIPGHTLLQHMAFASGSPRIERRGITRAVGRIPAQLAEGELFNRDLKPSNVLVRESDAQPVLIDAAGVREAGPDLTRERLLAPMLASLVIEPTGCGIPIAETDRWRALRACVDEIGVPARERRAECRRLWRAVAHVVDHHGDPTPKDNPLRGEHRNESTP